eukprot:TRINITY_DN9510_c0_g1_i1.p1 TRINITY_DN9510_c0_g1~~TRINITY_DN9510_c0_g1_i1.p1  ORF type:complete len:73 (-),score=1.97 TRINITY_DN9510_c0_g1_i1:102-320(-)
MTSRYRFPPPQHPLKLTPLSNLSNIEYRMDKNFYLHVTKPFSTDNTTKPYPETKICTNFLCAPNFIVNRQIP